MFKNLSIRNKLLTIILSVTIVSLLIGTGFIFWQNLRDYRDQLIHETVHNARLTSRYVLSPMLFDDKEGVHEILSELESIPYVEYAQVFNKEGNSVAIFNPANISVEVSDLPKESEHRFLEDHLKVYEPVMYEGEFYGTVCVFASRQPIVNKVNSFLVFVLILTAGIIVLAVFLAGWLQKYISRPVLNLVDTTHKITRENNLSLRVKKTTNDETGYLVDSFNTMVAQLQTGIEQRDKALSELQQHKERLEKTMQSAFDAIVLVDNHNIIESWNRAAEKIFGYKSEEIVGETFFDLFVSYTDIAEIIKDNFAKNTSVEDVELPAIGKDNRKFPVEISLAPSTIEGEQHYVVSLRDISRHKQIEQELMSAKEKAEESDRLKSAFLANMSHEIRTPLNVIIGFSDLLANPKLYEKKRNEYLSYISSSGKNLLNLINDIVDISKIEAGQLKIEKQATEIHKVLDDFYQSYINTSKLKDNENVRLILNKPENKTGLTIYSDPNRLNQVLSNLLNNAIKFTYEGFIEFGYFITQEDALIFYVRDTGEGIPKEKQDVIFDRFGQGHDRSTQNFGGTGLGLSISKKIVELLGGKMWLSSKVNEGSTFYFSLPNKKIGGETDKTGTGTKAEVDTFEWNDKTILIAEDEEANYLFLEEALAITNVNIIRTKDGKETVQKCRNNHIDLILMDLKMPEKDGYYASREIKEFKPGVPIVAQTAYVTSGKNEDRDQPYFDDFIAKPIKPSYLIKVISKFL